MFSTIPLLIKKRKVGIVVTLRKFLGYNLGKK
jgi:hypothetical protein